MLTSRFLFTSGYGLISFVVYTLIIRMMVKRWKDFNTTFFKLFIVEYFFNLLTFLNSFVTLRIPQNTCNDSFFSFVLEGNNNETASTSMFPLHIFFTLHYSMAFIQYSMIFLLSLNRLSMVILVSDYEKYWVPIFPWLILAVILFPFTQTFPILMQPAYYLYVEQLPGYTTRSFANVSQILDVLLYFMTFVTVLTACVNALSIIRLRFLADRITDAERNLLYVSFVAFIIQLVAAGDTLLLQFAVNDENRSSFAARCATILMPFASDLLTISHPWTLMYFSSKVRVGVIKMYWPTWNIKIFTSSSSFGY